MVAQLDVIDELDVIAQLDVIGMAEIVLVVELIFLVVELILIDGTESYGRDPSVSVSAPEPRTTLYAIGIVR